MYFQNRYSRMAPAALIHILIQIGRRAYGNDLIDCKSWVTDMFIHTFAQTASIELEKYLQAHTERIPTGSHGKNTCIHDVECRSGIKN